jgi:dipeptidyl aminopeptidase/acylaminoacyl peptidase
MQQTITIAQLQCAGITFSADEAIAIAQKLIHDRDPVSGEIMYWQHWTGDIGVAPGRKNAMSPPSESTPADPRPAQPTDDVQTGTASVTGSSTISIVPPLDGASPPSRDGTVPPDASRVAQPQSSRAAATIDRRRRPALPAAFASNASAMFVQSGTTSTPPGSLLSDGDEELEVMMIADDGAKNFHVQPSPDGRTVAFDSDRDGERGVYVANRDGSFVRRVSGAGYAAMPTWSPDSQQLAFVRAEPGRRSVWNLWLLSLDSGEQRRLTRYRSGQTWRASWFRDGRQVAYTHGDALVILDLQGGLTQEFKSPIRGRPVRMAAVSPDGRHVIFQVDRHGVWLLDLNDGAMRCALADPTAGEFAWTSDERRFVFHSRRTGEWGMWVMAST